MKVICIWLNKKVMCERSHVGCKPKRHNDWIVQFWCELSPTHEFPLWQPETRLPSRFSFRSFLKNPPGFQLPIPNCTFRVRPTSIRFARLLPCNCRFRVSDLLFRMTSPIFRSRKISACWKASSKCFVLIFK